MPRMDGLEATQRFRTWEAARFAPQPHRLLIFALSANVFDEKMASCAEAGMDGARRVTCCLQLLPLACCSNGCASADFLPKPLRLDSLRAALSARGM
jgi:CheY-like chemotaxis protein